MNVCVASGNEDSLITLDGLDEECSFLNLDFKTTLTKHFQDSECIGQTECNFEIPQKLWPS